MIKVFVDLEKTKKQDVDFHALIETLRKTIEVAQSLYPGFCYFVLILDRIRLKVMKDSRTEDLEEQFTERRALFTQGMNKMLDNFYREEGLWS